MLSIYFATETPGPLNANFLTASTENQLVQLPELAGGVKVPKSTIWFKPRNNGTGGLAFHRTNQSSPRSLSLYRYRRVNNVISEWQEFRFVVNKANSEVVYFQFHIPQGMTGKEGYEYLISRNSTDPNLDFGFFFLNLPSAGYTGDDSTPAIKAIDFVYRYKENGVDRFPNLMVVEYIPKKVLYKISGTTSGAQLQSLHYNMLDGLVLDSTKKVYYYRNTTLTIQDLANAGFSEFVASNNFNTYFDSRLTYDPNYTG